MSHDYVVVGAGAAGAALAARLSADGAATVLLIEAGPDYRAAQAPAEIRSPNPAHVLAERFRGVYHWPDLMARRTRTQEPRPYWRGLGVGGSTAINGHVAVQPFPDDFDHWEHAGCKGWSGEEVLPAIRRAEDDEDFGSAPYHGCGGPVPVRRAPLDEWGAVDRALRAAALELGYGECQDGAAPGASGVTPLPACRRDGARFSTNDAYLEPARSRENLTIRGSSLVDRVLVDGGRVVGVRVTGKDGTEDLAAREVVLAAGAVHSPAILLRSGIGPAAALRELGIRVIHDLPGVGENLLEHPLASFVLTLDPTARAASAHARYTNCCVRYSSGLAGTAENDMSVMCLNLFGTDDVGLSAGMIGVSAFQSFSQGRLTLASPDPRVDPQVDLDMLRDRRDLIRMRDGVRRLRALAESSAVRSIVLAVSADLTGRALATLDDDEAIDAWLLDWCLDSQHAAGTCRMGAPDDPGAVVDPDCCVLGVAGLRVVDASVMPLAPRTNPFLACVAIAEHAASRIRPEGSVPW
jgi:5-(hydroxymethyl)furfural/furfural oxidase